MTYKALTSLPRAGFQMSGPQKRRSGAKQQGSCWQGGPGPHLSETPGTPRAERQGHTTVYGFHPFTVAVTEGALRDRLTEVTHRLTLPIPFHTEAVIALPSATPSRLPTSFSPPPFLSHCPPSSFLPPPSTSSSSPPPFLPPLFYSPTSLFFFHHCTTLKRNHFWNYSKYVESLSLTLSNFEYNLLMGTWRLRKGLSQRPR